MCFHISKLSFELFINCNGVHCSDPTIKCFIQCSGTPVMLSLCAVKSQCSKSVEEMKLYYLNANLSEQHTIGLFCFGRVPSVSDFQLHDNFLALNLH